MSVHVRQTVRNSSRSIAFWVVVGTAMIATLVNLGSSRGWFTDSLGMADENRSPERTKSEAILREGTPVTDWVAPSTSLATESTSLKANPAANRFVAWRT